MDVEETVNLKITQLTGGLNNVNIIARSWHCNKALVMSL